MSQLITPILKQSLADNLAQELKNFIVNGGYVPGDKLPPTVELAQRFGVGLPTLREGLKKLETIGAIEVKHGSGVYVGQHINSIILMNPIVSKEAPTQKQLLDLIEVRMSIEPTTAALAAVHATPEQKKGMGQLLQAARESLQDENVLNQKNMMFHISIANASGNAVFHQILAVLISMFRDEQRLLIDIFHSKEQDHAQHVEIFEAIKGQDDKKAANLMKSHLRGVQKAIFSWKPTEN